LLNISKATFWKWLKLKKLPQPVKIGKITAWKAEDIERFLDELK
jgi:predicted DNA-binding transcriptional regulator AlpA